MAKGHVIIKLSDLAIMIACHFVDTLLNMTVAVQLIDMDNHPNDQV